MSTLKNLNWEVEVDEFTDETPIGKKRFANIIATKDPSASRRLVLSAHYDSKWFPDYPQNQVRGQKFKLMHAWLKYTSSLLVQQILQHPVHSCWTLQKLSIHFWKTV